MQYATLIIRDSMLANKRDGGKMSKTIEKIIISPEGIDVISNINGISEITQISLNEDFSVVKAILEKHNLSDIINYEFDEKIVRALAVDERGEQLRDYLEICKQLNNGNKRIKLVENMPEIEYNLRSLRTYEY